eukprot:5011723-Prymnesium_polylepis.1
MRPGPESGRSAPERAREPESQRAQEGRHAIFGSISAGARPAAERSPRVGRTSRRRPCASAACSAARPP